MYQFLLDWKPSGCWIFVDNNIIYFILTLIAFTVAYSEPFQTSWMERFAKIVKGRKPKS